MNKNLFVLCAALLSALSLMVPRVALANENNLLKNPSFELKSSPDKGGWALFDEGMYSQDQARTGKQSMFHYGYSRSVPYPPFFIGSVSGSFQELPAVPGSQWRLTGYGLTARKLRGTPAYGLVQVSFFDARGKDLGTVETAGGSGAPAKTSNEVNNGSPPGEWIFLDTGIATAPEGTVTIQAFTLYVDFSHSNTSQGVYFDDLNLCALGEEGTNCKNL